MGTTAAEYLEASHSKFDKAKKTLQDNAMDCYNKTLAAMEAYNKASNAFFGGENPANSGQPNYFATPAWVDDSAANSWYDTLDATDRTRFRGLSTDEVINFKSTKGSLNLGDNRHFYKGTTWMQGEGATGDAISRYSEFNNVALLADPGPWKNGTCGRDYLMGSLFCNSIATAQHKNNGFWTEWVANPMTTDDILKWEAAEFPSDVYEKMQDLFHGTRNPLEGPADGSLAKFVAVDTTTINGPPSYDDFNSTETNDTALVLNSPYNLVAKNGLGAGSDASAFKLGGPDNWPRSTVAGQGLNYVIADGTNITSYNASDTGNNGRMHASAWPVKGSSYNSTLSKAWTTYANQYYGEFNSDDYRTSFKIDQLGNQNKVTQAAVTKYAAYNKVGDFYYKRGATAGSHGPAMLAHPARKKADGEVGNLGDPNWTPKAEQILQQSLAREGQYAAPISNGRWTGYGSWWIAGTIFEAFYWGPWRCPDTFNYWFAIGTRHINLCEYKPTVQSGFKKATRATRYAVAKGVHPEKGASSFNTLGHDRGQFGAKEKTVNAKGLIYKHAKWEIMLDAYNYMRKVSEDLCEAVSCFFRLDVALRKAEKELVEANEDIVSGDVPDDVDPPTADDKASAKAWLEYHESLDGDIGRLGSGYHKKMMFKEQCYLLSNIFTIANYKKNVLDRAQIFIESEYDKLSEAGTLTDSKKFALEAGLSAGKAIQTKNSDPPYSLLIDGDSYGFINKLTQNPNQVNLFNMRNHDISTLQPQIRLYKIGYDDDDKAGEIEFKFDSHHNQSKELQSALKNRNKRGSGTGVKTFSFTYDGSNPFSAKKSIRAKLTIFANTFDELLECKGKCDEDSGPFDGYKYVDLALKTSNTQKMKSTDCKGTNIRKKLNDELSKLNFRLKAVIGWAFPKGNTSHMTDGVKDAIYDSFVTLNLTPTTHDFSFDEMGRVTFTINYLAYVEDFFDQTNYNVFMATKDSAVIVYNQIKRNLEYEYWSDKCEPDQLNKIRKSYSEQIHEEKRILVSQLIMAMEDQAKIYYITMPYEGLRDWMSKGPFASDKSEAAVLTSAQSDSALRTNIGKALKRWNGHSKARSVAMSLSVTDPNNATIPFFYLCDLVDLVIHGIQTSLKTLTDKKYSGGNVNKCVAELKKKELQKSLKQFQRYRIILGPVEIVNQKNALESAHVNFGDMPISVKYFVEWLTDKLAKKQESVYPLGKFMNDLMQGLVRNFLNNDGCFNYSIKQRTSLQQAAVTAYRYTELETISHEYAYIAASQHNTGGAKRVKYYGGSTSRATPGVLAGVHAADGTMTKQGEEGWPLLNVSGKRHENDGGHGGVENEDNYLIFYAGRTQPLEKMTGDTATDAQAGIMHYVLGKDRGIIKNISLTKTDTKGLAEVRFEQEGFDGLKQLRVVYDVNIDTYPNVQAFPGTYIFVDPRGFAPSTNLKPDDELNLTQYGIGGYYMIIRSEHTFGSGMANTRIFAKWVNHLAHEPDEDASADDYKPSKCTTLRAYKNID